MENKDIILEIAHHICKSRKSGFSSADNYFDARRYLDNLKDVYDWVRRVIYDDAKVYEEGEE